MRKVVSTEKSVAQTIWFLATGADYRTIGHLFVSKSTVCIVIKEVCAVMVERLISKYIKMPTVSSSKGGC